jgi:hypothetical protein
MIKETVESIQKKKKKRKGMQKDIYAIEGQLRGFRNKLP